MGSAPSASVKQKPARLTQMGIALAKYASLVLLVFLLSVLSVNTSATTISGTQFGELSVTIVGFKNSQGNARIALIKDKSRFLSPTLEPYRHATLKLTAQEVTHTFKDLPYGKYAVSVFHDENANNILDRNPLGMPTEPFGLSNNARPSLLGPPDFESAQFQFGAPSKRLIITVETFGAKTGRP
ncbi:DUF2141 domain-containing protein [Kaarinaea lacus]